MANITVCGKKYKVVEDMGYQRGVYVKAVWDEDESRERIAIKGYGGWEWSLPFVLLPPSRVSGQ